MSFFETAFQIGESPCHRLSALNRLSGLLLGSYPGISKQVLNESTHPAVPLDNVFDKLLRFGVEMSVELPHEQLGAASHISQGFLQIMTGGVNKLFQILIRAPQFFIATLKRFSRGFCEFMLAHRADH
jgi:hypothetical protein